MWYPLFQAQWDRCYKLEHVDDISFREITPIILESKCGNRMWKYSIKKEDYIFQKSQGGGAIVKNVVVVVICNF
jgi:hypothetical protein